MRRCVIVTGGDYAPIGPTEEGDFVLACDRGYEYVRREGLVPDLLLGDFDSYAGALPEGVPVERFQKEKDDTDTMLAIRWAAAQGFEAVRLCCALGGRLDHLLANIQSLHFALEAGMEAEAGDAETWLRVLRPGSYTIPRREGKSLSLFALSERVRGLTLCGTKYELSGAELRCSFPLGVSNEFSGAEVRLRFDDGVLLLMCCPL